MKNTNKADRQRGFAGMPGSGDLDAQIAETEAAIQPLHKKLMDLREQKREANSHAFIALYKIKLEDVELSEGEGKPWFGCVGQFALWIKQHTPRKTWAEWNGVIYCTADLVADRMPDMPGRMAHLRNTEVSAPAAGCGGPLG